MGDRGMEYGDASGTVSWMCAETWCEPLINSSILSWPARCPLSPVRGARSGTLREKLRGEWGLAKKSWSARAGATT